MDDYDYDFGSSGYGFDDVYGFDYDGAIGDQEFADFMAGAAGDQEFMDFMTQAAQADQSSGIGDFIKSAVSTLGSGAKDFLKKALYDPATGKVNLAGLGTAAMGLYSLTRDKDSGGYNKPVPKMEMVREQVQYNDPNRRPGESGRQYFTDPRFVAQGNADALAAAKAASAEQAAGLQAAAQVAPAPAPNPYAGKMNLAYAQQRQPEAANTNPIRDGLRGAISSLGGYKSMPQPTLDSMPTQPGGMPNRGGLASLMGNYQMPALTPEMSSLLEMYNASKTPQGAPRLYDAPENVPPSPSDGLDQSYAVGGLADAGRYLQGKTDGMADEIETSIDGEQPALLSHGEFVIPADVVSHLGNGNSEAGAEKLYAMMDKIREARTGTKEQGKEIDADKFLSAASGGLMAAYAGGGSVQKFQTGGTPVAPTPTTTAGGGVPLDTSRTSTLSPWVGDYVTNALGQGAALAQAPYQAYQGPLTAGPSELQQQAFAGASEMAQAGYTPGQFTGSFTPQLAQQYMNPYLQASLDPQLRELKRQSDIARLGDAERLTRVGAYGGSRQAIMESEGRRNLLDKQQDVLGTGYKTAYDLAAQQYAKERGEEEASRQFGANFGLKSIDQLSGLGSTQRGITSEGLAADKAAFEEQRDFAYKMPQYQLNLLQGLPIGASTTASDQTGLAGLQSQISGLAGVYRTLEGALKNLGQTPTSPAAPAVQKP